MGFDWFYALGEWAFWGSLAVFAIEYARARVVLPVLAQWNWTSSYYERTSRSAA